MLALARAAEDAAAKARDAAAAESRAKAALQSSERTVRQAEAALAKAEADLAAAEKLIAGGGPPKRLEDAEKRKAAASSRIDATRAQLDKAREDAAAKREAADTAHAAATAAATAQAIAADAAEQARLATSPVSVFVSRKTQRIYVRKAFHPLWEGPAFIRDPDKPIGTFVFTASGPKNAPRAQGWTVVSLFKNPTDVEPPAPRAKVGRHAAPAELPLTDAAAAQAALDRLEIPAEIAGHISETVLPGSSLVISDEPPHLETGKDTDFVVIMSGQPQGGITIRQPKPAKVAATIGRDRDSDDDDDRPVRRQRRSRGGYGFGGWFDD